MAYGSQIFFQEHVAVAKSTFGFFRRCQEGMFQIFFSFHHTDALAAAASGSFYQNGIADFRSQTFCFRRVMKDFCTGYHRHTDFLHELTGIVLITHGAKHIAVRTNENDALFFAKCRKLRVFGQKAIAGMDGFRIGCQSRTDDIFLVQIAVCRRVGTDTDSFVCQCYGQGILVCFGIYCYGFDAHFLTGTNDADSYLPSVCNENF